MVVLSPCGRRFFYAKYFHQASGPKGPKRLGEILEGMRTGLVLTLLAGLWVKSAQKLGDFEQKVNYENELSNCLKADKFDYGERGEINMSKNWFVVQE
jgi:hypothetical protein